jgi:hypothetical protein
VDGIGQVVAGLLPDLHRIARLEEAFPRAARVTELRFFGGLQESGIAAELSVSEITVKRDWKFAGAWLASQLDASMSQRPVQRRFTKRASS